MIYRQMKDNLFFVCFYLKFLYIKKIINISQESLIFLKKYEFLSAKNFKNKIKEIQI